jgi:signal transduction histidine kinase/PAS domain-containing protein
MVSRRATGVRGASRRARTGWCRAPPACRLPAVRERDVSPGPSGPAPLEQLRARLRELTRPAQMLEEIFASAPVGLQIFSHDGRSVLVNPMHTELFGSSPPPDYNVFEDTLLIENGLVGVVRRAFQGERIVVPPIWYDPRDLRNVQVSSGRRFAVGAELVPLRLGEDGSVDHVLFVFQDVTAAHQAREQSETAAREAEQARREAEVAASHSAFLTQAGRVLSASLDYETTLARVARLATPNLADFCIVDVLADDGSIRRVAAVHADPAGQPLLDELVRKFPPSIGSPQPAMRVIESRQPELLVEVDPQVVAEHVLTSEHGALIQRLGVLSHLAVPLLLGERTLGAISLGYAGPRRYSAADVPLAEALASTAATAIRNAQLYRDAELARAQAEAANRAKDEFLAMLGHELRNPLAPIVTALELTREREGPSRERSVIERQVEHMRRLVDDLLDVARIARGKLELDRRPLELADAVRDGLELARPLIDERRHRTQLELGAVGQYLLGDRMRVAQVVANLLTNAARYTEPGGLITLRIERRGDELALSVRDTGVGMSAELLPRVFELFAQAAQPTDRGLGGLGLGLAIVKSFVELHGGRVYARSEGPGCGSEFEVILPALAGEALAAPRPAAAPSTAPTRARILIVDDNADAADLLASALASRGYDVLVAHDPQQALALARQQVPRLALLDIGLPGMDGYELASLLRAEPGLGALQLVALTGYGQPTDRARSSMAGFSEHLVKPASTQQVQAVIQQLLAAPT